MADAGTAERTADGITNCTALAPAGDDWTLGDHLTPSPFLPASGIGGRAILALGRRAGDPLRDQAGISTDRILDRFQDIAVVREEGHGVLAALADPLAAIGEPGT